MRKLLFALLLAVIVVGGCTANSDTTADSRVDTQRVATDEDASADGEVTVPLSKVPMIVLSAAQKEVPGIVLARAEREVEGGVVVYDLAGKTPDGKMYEIEVTAAGVVLEVEEDDDDDDADDEDDDGDDDDDDDDHEDDDD